MTAKHVPPGYASLMPYLTVQGAGRVLDFVKTVFDDIEIVDDHRNPDGSIGHAAVKLAGGMIEVSEAKPEWPSMPAAIHVYVADTDGAYRRALAAGAVSLFEPADMFYGERGAGVRDACGNNWYFATFQRTVGAGEIARGMAARGGQ